MDSDNPFSWLLACAFHLHRVGHGGLLASACSVFLSSSFDAALTATVRCSLHPAITVRYLPYEPSTDLIYYIDNILLHEQGFSSYFQVMQLVFRRQRRIYCRSLIPCSGSVVFQAQICKCVNLDGSLEKEKCQAVGFVCCIL